MKERPVRADRTLYLVRHAIAAERGPAWPDDTRRPLTHRGAARMRQVAGGLDALGVRLDALATSPLVRAEQTAKLLASGLRFKPDPIVVSELGPGSPPAETAAALSKVEGDRLAAVGHEPDLGVLAAWLLGAHLPPPFKKGGVCCLELRSFAAGGASLIWMATPRMLRALANDAN